MAKEFGRLKNIANFGDIIKVAGYEGRSFRVASYTHELDHQPDYIFENILYDVYDVITGEYLLAYQDDISEVSSGDSPKIPAHASAIDTDFGWEYVGDMSYKAKEEKTVNKPRELSKEERIDRLLTEISDYQYLIRDFGDDNNAYKTRIEYAKMQLEKLTGGKQG